MLIQCTSCGSQAKIPDSKEGAKVKCPSCGHVYVARPKGRAGARQKKEDPTKYFLIGGVVLAAIVIMIMASRGGKELPKASEKAEDKGPTVAYIDPMTWDGPTVTLARSLHQAAFTGNNGRLSTKLDSERAYVYAVPEKLQSTPITNAAKEAAEAAAAEAAANRIPWNELDESERFAFADGLVARAMLPAGDGAVAGWKPFDGKVELLEDGYATVRLKVQATDASIGLEDRWTQWTFYNPQGDFGPDDAWRWVRVERWVSPEEAAKMRAPRTKKAEKKTLSDGSVVFESEVRTIEFPADVSPEEQARLLGLVEDYVGDVDAPPRKRTALRDDLLLAGKNAVPALLTKMSDVASAMSKDNEQNLEDRIRLNWIHELLRDITGHETTFDVAVEMGATQERIDSGLKQWFAWYDRKFKRFEERAEAVDPLADDPDLQPKTEEERRLYEKAKREIEAEKRREAQKEAQKAAQKSGG